MLSSNEMKIEDFIIIWLDENMNEHNEYYRDSIIQLRTIVNSLKTFNDNNQCIDFLTGVINKNVFLILSNTLTKMLVPLINGISHLDSIYIFSNAVLEHQQSIKSWENIQGTYNNISNLVKKLSIDVKQSENDLTPINMISASSNESLDEISCSFMYSQLLNKILISIEYDEKAKTKFINYLHNSYADNKQELVATKQFEKGYKNYSAAWWYTKESFIYAVLNAALRIPNVDIIVNMSFFIKDLHEQIKEVYMQKKETENLTLYRGQGMSIIDLENLKNCQDGLFSFNCFFLSTSRDRDISFLFADSARQKSNTVGILFTIEIDPSISTVPYASLKDISYYSKKQNAEEEILFSMHTVYRIGHIKQIDNNFWAVNLILTNDNDVQLKLLTARAREELGGVDKNHALVPLLLKMGEFKKAEEVAFTLIQSTSELNLNDTMHYSFYLGQVKYVVGDYSTAFSYFEKAIINLILTNDNDVQLKLLTARAREELGGVDKNHALVPLLRKMGEFKKAEEVAFTLIQSTSELNLTDTMHYSFYLGQVKYVVGDYSTAFSYFEKAISIAENCFSSNHSALALFYNRIGLCYDSTDNHSAALLYYEKALNIQENNLISNHPHLAATYMNTALAYVSMGNYTKALSFYEKAKSIQEEILPPIHPDLATCYNNITLNITQKLVPKNYRDIGTQYNNIGMTYYEMKDYSTALSYYEKILHDHKQSHFEVSSSVATVNNNMGLAYNLMEDHSKALLYHKTAFDIIEKILPSSHSEVAFEIYEKSLPSTHPELAKTYANIGGTYKDMKDYSTALSYHKRALQTGQQSIPSNHSQLIKTYHYMATTYKSLCRYSDALSCLHKALEIQEEILSANHRDLATTWHDLGLVYFEVMDYSNAVIYLQKSVDVRERLLSSADFPLGTEFSDIGLVYKTIGNYTKASLYYEEALQILKIHLPDTDHKITIIHNNIAGLYLTLGNHLTALLSYKNVLEIREKSLPPNDLDLATTNNNIGMVYAKIGDYHTALSYLEKTFKIPKHSKSCSPNILADTHGNLAPILFLLHQYEEATKHAEQAVNIAIDTFGNDHPKSVMFANLFQQRSEGQRLILSIK
ncbi:unnamed protein product [Rotaria magnacalcarata]|uniref:Uncharacterized protein n=4 Tax=Rotaria magnacalcarata TaxID=392030 RepID=A0A816U290_9BILA|nr:unnamed protein product [Rotaria magnacalcarata]